MNAPAGWHDNHAEHTCVWSTSTRSIPNVLHDLAEILAETPAMLLLCVYVMPDPDPSMLTVQATVSTL